VIKIKDMKSVQLVVALGLFVAGTIASVQQAMSLATCSSCATTYQDCFAAEAFFDFDDLKAVTSDELLGCVNPKTKEWKDGVFSVIMRDITRTMVPKSPLNSTSGLFLMEDIDLEWIESCNTVMDGNKVLTLVSQERIPLTPEMRLILEISHLRNATPATISRGGVLFINDSDMAGSHSLSL
jgi:dynein heavy chain, axonemal